MALTGELPRSALRRVPGVAYNAPMDRVSWPGDEACGGLPSPSLRSEEPGVGDHRGTSVARVGLIDMCSQAELLSARRPDTPA